MAIPIHVGQRDRTIAVTRLDLVFPDLELDSGSERRRLRSPGIPVEPDIAGGANQQIDLAILIPVDRPRHPPAGQRDLRRAGLDTGQAGKARDRNAATRDLLDETDLHGRMPEPALAILDGHAKRVVANITRGRHIGERTLATIGHRTVRRQAPATHRQPIILGIIGPRQNALGDHGPVGGTLGLAVPGLGGVIGHEGFNLAGRNHPVEHRHLVEPAGKAARIPGRTLDPPKTLEVQFALPLRPRARIDQRPIQINLPGPGGRIAGHDHEMPFAIGDGFRCAGQQSLVGGQAQTAFLVEPAPLDAVLVVFTDRAKNARCLPASLGTILDRAEPVGHGCGPAKLGRQIPARLQICSLSRQAQSHEFMPGNPVVGLYLHWRQPPAAGNIEHSGWSRLQRTVRRIMPVPHLVEIPLVQNPVGGNPGSQNKWRT